MEENQSPIVIPQPLGLYAGDLFDRSNEFLLAFEALPDGQNMRHARYSLLAHGIELAIKSFLAAKGVHKVKLKKYPYGHNIVSMWSEAEKTGLVCDVDLRAFVANTAEMNEQFDFRYPSGYHLNVWGPQSASDALRRMLAAIHPDVDKARVRATLQFAAMRGKYEWKDE